MTEDFVSQDDDAHDPPSSKLALMNRSGSTEEGDNQTFIKCLKRLYMHNVKKRDGSVFAFTPKYVTASGSNVNYQRPEIYRLSS